MGLSNIHLHKIGAFLVQKVGGFFSLNKKKKILWVHPRSMYTKLEFFIFLF